MPTKDELDRLPRGVIDGAVADIREAIVTLNKLLIEDNTDKSFALKKQMTSLIRRIAPMGISTNIIFTANARALRHMIVQRTSPHAEVEIQQVFRSIAGTVKKQAPAIFADLQAMGDGSYESRFAKWTCNQCGHTIVQGTEKPGPCPKCGVKRWDGYVKERGKV